MSVHTEQGFESAIEAALVEYGGYVAREPADYEENLALFPDDVIGFLQDSQPRR